MADTVIKVVVEYKFAVSDPKAAGLIAFLIGEKGVNFGSDNYSMWDFNPTEEVTFSEVLLSK